MRRRERKPAPVNAFQAKTAAPPQSNARTASEADYAAQSSARRERGQAGFEEFVAARWTALVKTAYLLTGSRQDAEDLVQTALLRIVPHWPRISHHPEPYTRRVLARESVNRWRKQTWRETPTHTLPEQVAQPTQGAYGDQILLRAALQQLTAQQRAVIVLRYFDDLSIADTADMLGLSHGTVKSHTHDALNRLRRIAPELMGTERHLTDDDHQDKAPATAIE